jgi:phosphatidylglycerol:prolipoprotein diacylglycerol transferase
MENKYIFFPYINPKIFSMGSISLTWYGLMYFIGFIFSLWYGKKKYVYKKFIQKRHIENLIYQCFIGLFIGGKVGYIFFYKLFYFLQNKIILLKIWSSGMSFHGGLIGVIIVCFIFSKKNKIKFFKITDFIAILTPFSLGIGRLGNLMNNELWGRVAIHSPYSFFFLGSLKNDLQELKFHPQFQEIIKKFGALPRYPSQIFEFLLEGIILFIILNTLPKKKSGVISAFFLIYYGIFRIFIEFFREPDIDIGLLYNRYTIGQILSTPMIFIGIMILIKVNLKK